MKQKIFIGSAVIALTILILSGCGGGSNSDVETIEALPEIAVVDYSPLNPVSGTENISSSPPSFTYVKTITIDDNSPVIGNNLVWMLQATQQSAQNTTQMLEGMVMEDSNGRSLLKTLASEMEDSSGAEKSSVMGPHSVESPSGASGSGFVAMDFSAFEGCDSSGVYTTSVSASSPLSFTAFVGSSSSTLTSNPAFSLCITDLTEGSTAGTVWLRPLRAQAMIDETVPTSTAAVMKTTWNDNYTEEDCPFTSCRKFVSLMYDPDHELAEILPAGAQIPDALSSTVYISKTDSDLMYVKAKMHFSEDSTPVTTGGQDSLRCFIDNGFGVNAFTNGTVVAGTFTNYYNDALPTILNGGIVETDECGDDVTPGTKISEIFEAILGSFAEGACHTATKLVTSADCEIADTYTLTDPPSLDNVETDSAFPPDAPSTY